MNALNDNLDTTENPMALSTSEQPLYTPEQPSLTPPQNQASPSKSNPASICTSISNSSSSPASRARKKVRAVVKGVIIPTNNLCKQSHLKKQSDTSKVEEILIKSINFISSLNSKIQEFFALIKPTVEIFVLYDTLISHVVVLLFITLAWLGGILKFGIIFIVIIIILTSNALDRINKKKQRSFYGYIKEKDISNRLGSGNESLIWFNLLLKRTWVGLEPAISESAKGAINDVLRLYKPGIFRDLSLSIFTLGSIPPKIISVRATSIENRSVELICDTEFVPPFDLNDTTETSPPGSKQHSGSKIVMNADIGKGFVPISLPISVTNIFIRGILKLKLEFISSLPYVKQLSFSFLEPPEFDFDLRPLKMLDIMDLSVLSKLLRDTVKLILSSCIVEPNIIDINLEDILFPASSIDPSIPVGILEVSIIEGRNIKNVEFAGKSDPYVVVRIGKTEFARTKVIQNTLDPFWNEKFFIPITIGMLTDITDASNQFTLTVYDYNNINKDTLIGITDSLSLLKWLTLGGSIDYFLHEANRAPPDVTASEAVKLIRYWGPPHSPYTGPVEVEKKLKPGTPKFNRVNVGNIFCSFAFTPVARSDNVISQDNTTTTLSTNPDVFLESPFVIRAVLLDSSSLKISDREFTMCSVYLNKSKMHTCTSLRKGSNPQWFSSVSTYVKNPKISSIVFEFSLPSKAIGRVAVSIKDIVANVSNKEHIVNLENTNNNSVSKIRINFYCYPLDTSYVPQKEIGKTALGLLKVDVLDASNLQNLEFVGKSDPYAKVYMDDRYVGTTHVETNTIDPKWEETFYCICYDYSETLRITLWDSNNIKRDRSLGMVSCTVSELMGLKNEETDFGPTEQYSVDDDTSTECPNSVKSSAFSNMDMNYPNQDGSIIIKPLGNDQFDIWIPVYSLKDSLLNNYYNATNGKLNNSNNFNSKDSPLSHSISTSDNVYMEQDSPSKHRKLVGKLPSKEFLLKKLWSNNSGGYKYRGLLHLNVSLYRVKPELFIPAMPEDYYRNLEFINEERYLSENHKDLSKSKTFLKDDIYIKQTEAIPDGANTSRDFESTSDKLNIEPENLKLQESIDDRKSSKTYVNNLHKDSEISTNLGMKNEISAQSTNGDKISTQQQDPNDSMLENDEISLNMAAISETSAHPVKTIIDLSMIDKILDEYQSGIITFWVHEFRYSEKQAVNNSKLMSSDNNLYAEIAIANNPAWRSRIMKCDTSGTYFWSQSFEKYVVNSSSQTFTANIISAQGTAASNTDQIIGTALFTLSNSTVGIAKKLFEVKNQNDQVVGSVKLSLTYAPIYSSSIAGIIEGPGVLSCDIVSANKLEAVDSDGTSDPYVLVLMNGNRIFETNSVYKSLSPVWNKGFSVEVANCLRTTIEFQIRDTNKFMKNKTIGVLRLNLSTCVIPGSVIVKNYRLEEAVSGTILLRLLFMPKDIKNLGIKILKSQANVDELSNNTDADSASGIKKIKDVIGTTIVSSPAFVGKLVGQMSNINKTIGRRKDSQSSGKFSLLALADEFGIPVLNINDEVTGEELVESNKNLNDKQSFMSMPRIISLVRPSYFGKVEIKIMALDGVGINDLHGKSGLYVKLRHMVHGKEKTFYKTQVCNKKADSYTWDNEYTCVVVPPEKIHLLVLGKSSGIGRDTLMGECSLAISDILASTLEKKSTYIDWVNLISSSGLLKVHLSIKAISQE